MPGINHSDALFFTGYQNWRDVTTTQGEYIFHSMGLEDKQRLELGCFVSSYGRTVLIAYYLSFEQLN